MLEDGIAKVLRGETTFDELLRVVPYEQVAEFHARLDKRIFQWEAPRAEPARPSSGTASSIR